MKTPKTEDPFKPSPFLQPKADALFLSSRHDAKPQGRRSEILSLEHIVAARMRIDGSIFRTPCTNSTGLSELTGSQIFCKREYVQATGSFKERGARNALSLLPNHAARRGVIAASAGNHALGLAWHGRALGIPVRVVMPESAAEVKVSRCRALGARVILHGSSFEEARTHAVQLALK